MTALNSPSDKQPEERPINLSRRGFLESSLGALIVGVAMPVNIAPAAAAANALVKPGTRVSAFLEIRPDNTVFLRTPFIEGGQGIFTAMAQIVGEELDADPLRFTVDCAPPGADFLVMNGRRFTGGSYSVRSSYETMRRIGASARQMLLQAAATRLRVELASLTTEPGRVRHAPSGRALTYGELATDAAALPIPENVPLRPESDFRWIGKPVQRLDVRDKSTGRAIYAIDVKLDGMLYAAIQHAPRLGLEPAATANEAEVKAMRGVHSVHRLPGAVAVVADRWWHARRAVETLKVDWKEPAPGTRNALPSDFSSEGMRATMVAAQGPGLTTEAEGDSASSLRGQLRIVEAVYDAPYLAHGQLEPPSALARWNTDGTLELWIPNQAPELFQNAAAKVAGIAADNVKIHSQLLGGFFGRHFLYDTACPFPQAILLSRAVGRPVKVIWSREEEFLRDALRPLSVVRFRAGLDANNQIVALEAEAVGEGPRSRWFGGRPDAADLSVVEGLTNKPYAIPNRRIAHIPLQHPTIIGFWRSVGHSMNDFFYESFFDELADAGRQDPYELRLRLLADKPRHKALLEAVGELSGGWKRGPFHATDGSKRARGVAMASPFGSEVATIAEVSIKGGAVTVHDIWVAIDPGRAINPGIIEAQVRSAAALGLSSAMLEEVVYVNGAPQARNFDAYPILPPDQMPRVHVRILASGAPIGGSASPVCRGCHPPWPMPCRH